MARHKAPANVTRLSRYKSWRKGGEGQPVCSSLWVDHIWAAWDSWKDVVELLEESESSNDILGSIDSLRRWSPTAVSLSRVVTSFLCEERFLIRFPEKI